VNEPAREEDKGHGTQRHRFCPRCGTEAVAGASFCGDCGQSLAKVPINISSSDAVRPTHDGALSAGAADEAQPSLAEAEPHSESIPVPQLNAWSILLPFAPDTALLRLEPILSRSGTVSISARVPITKLSGQWHDQASVYTYRATLRATSGGTDVNFISDSQDFPKSLERSMLQEFSSRLTRNESSKMLASDDWSQDSRPPLGRPVNAAYRPRVSSETFGPRRHRWVLPLILAILVLMAGGVVAGVLIAHHANPSATSPSATHTHSYIDGYNFAAESVVPLEQSANRYYSPALEVQFCDQKAGDGETKPANDYEDEWIQGCEDGLTAKSTTPLTPFGSPNPAAAPTSPPPTSSPTIRVPNFIGLKDPQGVAESVEGFGCGGGGAPECYGEGQQWPPMFDCTAAYLPTININRSIVIREPGNPPSTNPTVNETITSQSPASGTVISCSSTIDLTAS